MPNTLRDEAKMLAARAQDLKSAPMMQRPALASDLVEDVAGFLVRLSEQVDAVTPYVDEIESYGGSA